MAKPTTAEPEKGAKEMTTAVPDKKGTTEEHHVSYEPTKSSHKDMTTVPMDINYTSDFTTKRQGNFTGNGTAAGFMDFLQGSFALPMWGIIGAAAVLLIGLIICLCIICKQCRKKKKGKNKGKKGTDKEPLVMDNYLPTVGKKDDAGFDSDKDSDTALNLGKLQYSLDYDMAKQELLVTVLQAADLPAMDSGGTSDPYVKVGIAPGVKKKEKTKVQSKSLNPVFNETFSFKVPYVDTKEKILTFSVYDFDRFSKDEMIGHLKIPLENTDLTQVVEQWGDLSDPVQDEENVVLGDICFTLHYVPVTGKLTVIILECKNLRKMGDGELANPYVKVDLYRSSKRHRKKKTTLREKTLNPYINESFVFDVPPDQIYLISLVITVMHHTKIGKGNEPIGQLTLGNNATGTEYRHWSDMLKNPRRPIAQWHPLQDLPDD